MLRSGFEKYFFNFIGEVRLFFIGFFLDECFIVKSGFDLCFLLVFRDFRWDNISGNGMDVVVVFVEVGVRCGKFLIYCSFFGLNFEFV